MSVGGYRHKIEVQEKFVTSYGTRGEPVYTWTTKYTTWAKVRGLNGREVYALQQRWPDVAVMIEAKWMSGIATDMRIVDTCCSRTFDIKEATDVAGDRRYLRFACKEIL